VIVDAVRTPIGKRKGALSGVHPVDLGARVLDQLARRNDLDPVLVEDVLWGCVTTIGEQSSNIGRWSALAAGWPDTVPGTTIDRACGSSMQALHFAAAGVIAGQYDIVIAGGVESMTRVPMGSTRNSGHGEARGPAITKRYNGSKFNQGTASDMVAAKWAISREQADAFSVESHARAAAATATGHFATEIVDVPVEVDGRPSVFNTDEGIRPDSSVETLAGLKTVFSPEGPTTAGNSSQISDGASAVLVMSAQRAAELRLQPLARFVSFASTAVDPVLMLTGPICATGIALRRANLSVEEVGVFEVNEAFATVPLAWLADTGADRERLNPNGGAIALGHPLGATGTRLTATLVHYMVANGVRYGLQAICENGGLANATVLQLFSG
jgi:acetyl-CoA acyltransferase